MNVGGRPHHFAFVKGGPEKHTATITQTREMVTLEAGVEDLILLRTSGAGFEGYLEDPFTATREASDRLLRTSIRARWRYREPEIAYGPCWHGVRQVVLDTFAEHESHSIQQTIYGIGDAVLNLCDEVEEIYIAMPDNHCMLVDLSVFGLENRDEIFLPVDEPCGTIEAHLKRDRA